MWYRGAAVVRVGARGVTPPTTRFSSPQQIQTLVIPLTPLWGIFEIHTKMSSNTEIYKHFWSPEERRGTKRVCRCSGCRGVRQQVIFRSWVFESINFKNLLEGGLQNMFIYWGSYICGGGEPHRGVVSCSREVPQFLLLATLVSRWWRHVSALDSSIRCVIPVPFIGLISYSNAR